MEYTVEELRALIDKAVGDHKADFERQLMKLEKDDATAKRAAEEKVAKQAKADADAAAKLKADADAAAKLSRPNPDAATRTLPGFERVAGCEHFWMITADPRAPSPIEGTQTLGMLMGPQPPTFDTVQRASDDEAVALYTSGTTGRPKGAQLTHSNILMNAMVTAELMRTESEEVMLVTLPLFHVFGQVVQMIVGFRGGSTLVLVPRFDPEAVLALMEQENVTMFAGVPTMYWALLNYPDADKFDLKKIAGNLKLAGSGGASLPLEVLRAFEEKYQVPILEGYGLSETSPVVTFNHLDKERKPGSEGRPVWGVEVRVVDTDDKPLPAGEPGEVLVRGHCVMTGYLNNPEATAEAFRGGWFHTGDIGQLDEDGYLYIVDRVKDMIIRGGFNVYPREIEGVLMTHPAVSLTAVVGVPDDEYGEEIKAYIVVKEGETIVPTTLLPGPRNAWRPINTRARSNSATPCR